MVERGWANALFDVAKAAPVEVDRIQLAPQEERVERRFRRRIAVAEHRVLGVGQRVLVLFDEAHGVADTLR